MIKEISNDPKDAENTLLRQNIQDDYDPYHKAEFLIADRHRRAHLIRQIGKAASNPNFDKCKCCGFPVEAEPFSLGCSLQDLSELGSGFPLFFEISRIFALIFFLGICLVSIPCIIGNARADKADDWDPDKDSWIIKSSLGNNGDVSHIFPQWQCILHIVYMILIILIYHLSRRRLESKDRSFDIMAITAKDYTVHVYGLGLRVTEEDVQSFFEQSGRIDGKTCKVIKVVFAYKIKEFVDKVKRLEDLGETLTMIDLISTPTKGLCSKKLPSKEAIQTQLIQLEKEIQKFEDELPAGKGRNLLIGQAFVTFETQEDARAVEMKFGKQWVFRVWRLTFRSICGIVRKSTQKIRPERIIAWIANEPNDIFWENLEIDFGGRALNMLKTYIATTFAISITFGMIYGMKILGNYEGNSGSGQNDSWKLRILSIWPSIIIVIINFTLSRLIRYFTSFEKPHTLTTYNISVSTKLTLAMFFNSAVIALIVNYDWQEDWFTRGGLVFDITYIVISNAFVSPLLYIFSPVVCLHRYRIRKVKRSDYISQHDANILIENPSVDMGQRYANMNKTVLLTFLYAPLIPVAYLFALIAIILEYWTFKYLLLRRHSWPQRLSGDLAKAMFNILPWSVLLYSIMNYIYMLSLNPSQSELAFIWMLVMLAYTFLPLELITDHFVKKDLNIWANNKKYDDVALTFVQDYDTMNPITSSEGHKRYAELLVEKNLVDQDKIDELKKSHLGGQNSNMSTLKKFARKKRSAEQTKNKKYGEKFMNLGGINLQSKVKKGDFRTEARRLTNKNLKPVVKQMIRKNVTEAVHPESETIEKLKVGGEGNEINVPLPSPNENLENNGQEKLIMNHPAYDFSGGSYYYKKYLQHRRLYQ